MNTIQIVKFLKSGNTIILSEQLEPSDFYYAKKIETYLQEGCDYSIIEKKVCIKLWKCDGEDRHSCTYLSDKKYTMTEFLNEYKSCEFERINDKEFKLIKV